MGFVTRATTKILAYGGGNWMWKAVTGAGRRPVIVTYHRVPAPDEPLIDRTQRYVSADEFTRQLEYLLRKRRPATLPELIADPDGAGPAFAVTFDDGYGDIYRVAFPILRRLGVNATVFVTTEVTSGRMWLWWDRLAAALSESVGKTFRVSGREYRITDEEAGDAAQAALTAALKRSPRRDGTIEDVATQLGVDPTIPEGLYMGWEEVHALRQAGWEIGGHSQTHRIYTTMTPEEARADVEGCTAHIEREIGERPRLFAYPNGRPDDYDEDVIAALRRAGYTGAVTTVGGPVRRRPDPFRMPRVSPRGGEPWDVFLLRLSGLYDTLKGV